MEAIMFFEFERALPETARKATGNITMQLNNLTEFEIAGSVDCYAEPNKTVLIKLKDFIATRVRLGQDEKVNVLMIEDE
jgi:hypothetical protein